MLACWNLVSRSRNIYASEALFRAGLNPRRAAGRISRAAMTRLEAAVWNVSGG